MSAYEPKHHSVLRGHTYFNYVSTYLGLLTYVVRLKSANLWSENSNYVKGYK